MNGTLADFARHIGVNKSSVTRAVQAGRIAREPDGSIDFDKALAAWHAAAAGRGDVAARHAAHRGSAIPAAQPGKKTAPGGRDSPPAGNGAAGLDGMAIDDGGRAKAKAALMHYENSSLKLEMALRRALRYELAAVRREAAGLGAIVRAGIERVIDTCAPRLAAAHDDLDRRRIIGKEIARLRWVIKREAPRALRRMRESGQGAAAKKAGAGGTANGGGE